MKFYLKKDFKLMSKSSLTALNCNRPRRGNAEFENKIFRRADDDTSQNFFYEVM